MKKILLIILVVLVMGCAEHKVDTFQEWCKQISGVNLEKKYRPFWAIIFSVSFNGDAIRDDFMAFLNKTHLEKVNIPHSLGGPTHAENLRLLCRRFNRQKKDSLKEILSKKE